MIYDEYSAEDDKRLVGIKIKNLKTKRIIDIKGDPNSSKGSLVEFRFMDNIKTDEYVPD